MSFLPVIIGALDMIKESTRKHITRFFVNLLLEQIMRNC